MIKVAICDDEINICLDIENALLSCVNKKSVNLDIDIYYSAESLYKCILSGTKYDLIFLDIELGKLDGISLSKKIRYQLLDEYTKIVFISWKKKYVFDLFVIRPLEFLIKPLSNEKICATFNMAYSLLKQDNTYFYYKLNSETRREHYKDILYFESDGRTIIIKKKEENLKFYNKLKTLETEVPSKQFWLVHKSYLVNCHKIIKFEYHQLTMENGDLIPISQSKRSEVRTKRLESWERY